MALPFPDLLEWWKERQRFLGWSNQVLSEKSNIPLGTINRIKAGEDDCRYSTMRAVIHALLGGYSVEFPCQKKLDQEFAHIESLEKQNAELLKNIEELNSRLASIDELHRNDIRVIKAEYMEEIAFLKEQLRAWQRQKT
jgi:predicted transcriptional regulator